MGTRWGSGGQTDPLRWLPFPHPRLGVGTPISLPERLLRGAPRPEGHRCGDGTPARSRPRRWGQKVGDELPGHAPGGGVTRAGRDRPPSGPDGGPLTTVAWLGDASCTDCPRLLSPRLCPGVPSRTGPSTGTTVSGSASEGSHLKVLPWISASSVQNEEEATSSPGEPEESTGGDASRHAKPSPLWLGSGPWRSCRRHLRNTDASQKRAPRARGEPRASAEWGARSPGEAVSFRDICRQLLSNRVSLPH